MSDFNPLQMDERLAAAQRGVPNPVLLSRQIGAADAAYRQWYESLRSDPTCEDDPLGAHRAVAGRTLYRDLDQLGETDPLRSYLKRWVLRLGERRVNAGLVRRLHYERHHREISLGGQSAPTSLARLLSSALRQSQIATHELNHYLLHSHSYASGVGALWERRAELERRWGVVADPHLNADPGAQDPVSAVDIARAWLERTQDMAGEYRCASLAEWLEQGLGRDAKLDWPSRLNWRTLCQWFVGGDLLTGLRLASKRLPELIAPASFLRGLERLGAEWSEALAPSDQFFVVGHDPFRLRTQAQGALFASLLLNPSFLKRCLAAEPTRIQAALRPLCRVLLLESRMRAFKVLVAEASKQGWSVLQETFMAETDHRFGFQVPPAAVGALLTPGEDCAAALPAMFLAAAHVEALVASHDEDWFRNPRGIDQLRSEAALPPPLGVEASRLARGADALYSRLTVALG